MTQKPPQKSLLQDFLYQLDPRHDLDWMKDSDCLRQESIQGFVRITRGMVLGALVGGAIQLAGSQENAVDICAGLGGLLEMIQYDLRLTLRRASH